MVYLSVKVLSVFSPPTFIATLPPRRFLTAPTKLLHVTCHLFFLKHQLNIVILVIPGAEDFQVSVDNNETNQAHVITYPRDYAYIIYWNS